jgi:hypothetical protein
MTVSKVSDVSVDNIAAGNHFQGIMFLVVFDLRVKMPTDKKGR